MARRVEIQADQFARFVEQRFEAQGRRGAAAEAFGRGPEYTENFSRTVRLGRNGTLDLQNVAAISRSPVAAATTSGSKR